MRYSIDKISKKPSYLQLYEEIKRDIINGVYEYNQKLPSKRVIAEETEVSVITVEHAYGLLYEEGYIDTKERSGYFVIYKKTDFIINNGTTPPKYFENNKNISVKKNLFPFNNYSKIMRKVLLENNENIFIKCDNKGLDEFRIAISKYLARSVGIIASKEQIIIGSGAEYFYSLITELISPINKIAVENPCYEKIKKVYKSNNITVEELNLYENGILTSELQKTQAKVLHVTPFNSYPSGITTDVSKKLEYLEWAKITGGIIIEDNYDLELTVSKKFDDTLYSLSNGKESVIYLNTFSHTISPSLRVGYMILPENLVKIYDKKLNFYSCSVPVFEQYVLTELLNSGEFERQVAKIRRIKRQNLK